MTARDDAVNIMDDFDSAWCRDGAMYGRAYLGQMLDAIPTDLLARLATERTAKDAS